MTNTIELDVAIRRAGLTKRAVAARLGITETSLYQKINNRTEFKASEVALLRDLLKIDNVDDIFFAKM